MNTPPLVQLADAVVEALNEAEPGTFSQPLHAERRYTFDYSLEEDLHELKVSVLPRNRDEGLASRARTVDTVEIDVGLQQHIDSTKLEEGDGLMALAQQVSDFFRFRPLGNATWLSSNMHVPYDAGHMRQKQVFTTVITLAYRMRR